MTQHVADRILAAAVAQLTAAGVAAAIDDEPATLPGVILQNIEDERTDVVGFSPSVELHELRFEAFCCDQATGQNLLTAIGDLHHTVWMALLGSKEAKSLGGLLATGLGSTGATYRTDHDRLAQPLGGWAINFVCTYSLRSDQPGLVEKERP